jgi:hypothetical protein
MLSESADRIFMEHACAIIRHRNVTDFNFLQSWKFEIMRRERHLRLGPGKMYGDWTLRKYGALVTVIFV